MSMDKASKHGIRTIVNKAERSRRNGSGEQKQSEMVGYEVLAQIPSLISRRREQTSGKKAAELVRDELLMTWLVVLPWKIRNLVQCKLAPKSHGGNLFKSELIASLKRLPKPYWVEDALEANSKQEFWQFYFRPEENQSGKIIGGTIPRNLIPILEYYVQSGRPALVNGADPGTLFLSESGGPLARSKIRSLIHRITRCSVGRTVNPHLFRRVFTWKWLEHNPSDFNGLRTVLWHSYPRTMPVSHTPCKPKQDESYISIKPNKRERGKTSLGLPKIRVGR